MYYTLFQWLFIFYTYCFIGWIWECCYVSVQEKKWVNRGFLHGPYIPIYGFGAIVILGLTLPFEHSILHIYFLGLFGASLLEYVTGATMEKIFHVRYWDYSKHKFNLNGHISLFVSLGWGIFSVLLVKVIHPPVENIMIQIPSYIVQLVSILLTVVIVTDFIISTREALDVKKLLKQMTENNKVIALLETKLDEITSTVSQTTHDLHEYIQGMESVLKENIHLIQFSEEKNKESKKELLKKKIQQQKLRKYHLLDFLDEKVNYIIEEIRLHKHSSLSSSEKILLTKYLKDLNEIKVSLQMTRFNILSQKDKKYRAAAKFIRRNPSSASREFKKAFDELKSLNELKKK